MKILVLLLLLAFPVSTFAQKTVKYPLRKHQIPPRSNDSLRIEIHRNDRLDIDFQLTKANFRGKLFTPFILSGATALLRNDHPNPDSRRNFRVQSIHLGILGSLASTNPFKGKPQINAYLEIKQYDMRGKLLRTGHLIRQPKSGHYKLTQTFDRDGFLTIKIHNFGKQRMNVKTNASTTAAFTTKDTIIFGGGDNPGTENDEPIAWENDLDGVTIVGTGTFANNNFIASYEAAFGPSETWTAVSASGGDGSGGGGGGGSSEPPSAEAKQLARELNKYEANECEARYVIDHLDTMPLMAPLLATNKTKVETYLFEHGMGAANDHGDVVQNAFKHALVSAYNYCSIGAQHAMTIADYHEICNGVNQNPNNQEWFMDDYNNHEGFDIAIAANCNQQAILNAVWMAYNEGLLHDINGNPTTGN